MCYFAWYAFTHSWKKKYLYTHKKYFEDSSMSVLNNWKNKQPVKEGILKHSLGKEKILFYPRKYFRRCTAHLLRCIKSKNAKNDWILFRVFLLCLDFLPLGILSTFSAVYNWIFWRWVVLLYCTFWARYKKHDR